MPTRAFLLPGQNYTGPFNPVTREYQSRYPPRDKLDAASKRHDLGYSKLLRAGINPYTRFNAADARYLKRIGDLPGWRARLARGVFRVKEAVMPARSRSRSRGRSRTRRSIVGGVFTPSVRKRTRSRSRSRSSARVRATGLPPAKAQRTLYGGRRTRTTGTTFGGYRGVGRGRRPVAGLTAKYGSRGMCQLDGSKTMDHVNYLGFSTLGPAAYSDSLVGGSHLYHLAAALLRKILRRHFRIEMSNHEEKPFNNAGAAVPITGGAYAPHKIDFLWETLAVDGTQTHSVRYTLIVDMNMTFRDAATEIVKNVFLALNVESEAPLYTLYGYQCWRRDVVHTSGGVVQDYQVIPMGIIPIWNWNVSVITIAKIAIQNATVSDDGSKDAHAIDKNPLRGKIFKFHDPVPRLAPLRGTNQTAPANKAGWLTSDINSDGVIFMNAAGGIGGSWNQLPSATQFRNVKTQAPLHMNPGQIMRTSTMFKFSGTLQRYLEGTIYNKSATSPATNAYRDGRRRFGESLLFCFEKVMSTGSDAVTINYEVSFYSSALVGKGPVTLLDPLQVAGTAAAVDQTTA